MPRKKAEVIASPSPPPDERLISTVELCRRYGITSRTAQRWRRSGHGPEWIKLTDGACAPVRYLESSVRVWLESRRARRS
jgi:predicted DNA-binding transcriptional regulator AlpA